MLIGIAIVVVTIVAALRYDEGPGLVLVPEGMPSLALRGGLTVTGTLGLFLIVSTIALRVRAREDKALDDITSAGD